MTLKEFNYNYEARMLSMSSAEPLDKILFFKMLRDQKSLESVLAITDFSNKMEKQEYKHGKLSKSQYLAHPYRVARLLMEHFPTIDESYIRLALCHNIIEVSVVSESLSSYLGSEMMSCVQTLTVDRLVQWDPDYKISYYKKINEKKITRMIKVFDKLDNLFTLSKNNDKEVKVKYLKEISTHVLPFVKLDMPFLEDYFEAIIKINYDFIG